jgi:Leucine-rich repeat (LRR) protein
MLDLRNNLLTGLDEMIFKGLANLKFVYLGNNQLDIIEPKTFLQLNLSLEVLDLESNQLSSLDSKIFQSLIKLKEINLGY